jgi:4,5-DOPA dioxygenase extradiol
MRVETFIAFHQNGTMDMSGWPPVLFLAHGAPTLALEGGAWAEQLARLSLRLPPLKAVLVCSAHWETSGGFRVGAALEPRTIHDFGGFPEALYSLHYPAPGASDLASRVVSLLAEGGFDAAADPGRGLDHGVWVPLLHLLPEARVPVVPLSLPRPREPRSLWAVGRILAPLREEGVLILGSGGLVHNLGQLDWMDASAPEPWAQAFETWMLERLSGDPAQAMDWVHAPGAATAVPTSEHLDPLWFALGAAGDASAQTLFAGWQFGNLSLRCLSFGAMPSR